MLEPELPGVGPYLGVTDHAGDLTVGDSHLGDIAEAMLRDGITAKTTFVIDGLRGLYLDTTPARVDYLATPLASIEMAGGNVYVVAQNIPEDLNSHPLLANADRLLLGADLARRRARDKFFLHDTADAAALADAQSGQRVAIIQRGDATTTVLLVHQRNVFHGGLA